MNYLIITINLEFSLRLINNYTNNFINWADLAQFDKENKWADAKICGRPTDFLNWVSFHPALHQQKTKLVNKL